MYTRYIRPKIVSSLFGGKTIILYGARQVGKTTLVQKLSEATTMPIVYLDGEDLQVRDQLSKQNTEYFVRYFGKQQQIVVIDEAQKIPYIGANLKIIHDHLPRIQLIATGSSSFDIAQHIHEPMTGRTMEYYLYPLSLGELEEYHGARYILSNRERILLYGLYPGIQGYDDNQTKKLLYSLCEQYVHKDLLLIEGIKKSETIVSLLQLLAWQIGSEVSYHELAQKLGLSIPSVQKYITILEKAFIIKRLGGYSRNLRKEITKSTKIYFRDLGIRNALIHQFAPLSQRNDVGQLWENLCIIELIKQGEYNGTFEQWYFWRTYDQQEIDCLSVSDTGKMTAYECKRSSAKKKQNAPTGFTKAYPLADFHILNPDSLLNYIQS